MVPNYTAYEDGTDRVFRNVATHSSDAGELTKRKNITFRTQGKLKSRHVGLLASVVDERIRMEQIRNDKDRGK